MAWKKGIGLGLTDKAEPKRSTEGETDKDTAFSKPPERADRENEIHGPGKGAHTEESEVRPRPHPGNAPPRRG